MRSVSVYNKMYMYVVAQYQHLNKHVHKHGNTDGYITYMARKTLNSL